MASTERQPDWEKIAHHLDGRDERLAPDEARIAEQTADDLTWLAEQMPAEAPHQVLLRVGAKMDQALAAEAPAQPRKSIWALVLGATASAAAVAAIVLAGRRRSPTEEGT